MNLFINNRICAFVFVVFSILTSFTSAFSHAATLSPFSASYTALHKGDKIGRVTMTLEQRSDDQYRLVYDSSAKLMMISDNRYEESLFRLVQDKIIPQHYQYTCSGIACRGKELNVVFDSDKEQFKIDSQAPSDWNGELDNQLFRLDIPLKLTRGATEFDYDFINYRGELKHYSMEVVGRETLSLPYGEVSSIKVKIKRSSNKRLTLAWFAPELDYTMVRLQQFKEGEEQGDVQLAEFNPK